MNIWLEKSQKNLLPLSEEKQDFKKALQEWFYTNDIVDHEQALEVCELCEKDELRYHFKIANGLGNALWVGSKCIEKFNIKVVTEDGVEIIDNKDAYLLKQAKLLHIKNAFNALEQSNPIGKICDKNKIELDAYCINHFNLGKKINAKMLNYLFIRFDEEKIFFEKRFFSISTKSKDDKEKFLKLSQSQYNRIEPALSSHQKKYYKEYKH